MRRSVEPGAVVAGLRLERLLGEGATGGVYLARDPGGSALAVKVLDPELSRDDRFRARFLREMQVVASLDHPNVVQVVSAGEDDGLLYIAMPVVEGQDLRELLRRDGPLEPVHAVTLVEQVAAALGAAHAEGIVHRDVKPANILVTAGGDALLCDFGLARNQASAESLTGERGLLGTVAYIAPEQIEGRAADPRADVYALGCVLMESLTGEPPFPRESELAVLYAHLNEPPPRPSQRRPDLPVAFDVVLASALAKDPAARPQTAGDLAAAARRALTGAPAPRERRRWALVAGTAALVAVAAVAVGSLGGDGPDRRTAAPTAATGVNKLAVLDATSGRVLRRVSLGGEPARLVLGARRAWAVLAGQPARIARVDGPRTRSGSPVPLPFAPAWVIAAGGALWAAEDGGPRIARLDDRTGRVTRTLTVPGRTDQTGPLAVADGSLWIGRGPEVLRVDPRSGRVLRRFATPVRASLIAAGGGAVWVASSQDGRVVRIDPLADRITARTRLHGWISDLAVGGGYAWAAAVPDDVVFKLSGEDAGVAGTIAVDASPDVLAWGGGALWAISRRDRSLTRIDPRTGAGRSLRLDARPVAAAPRGRTLWTVTAVGAPRLGSAPAGGGIRIPIGDDQAGTDPAVAAGPLAAQIAHATCARLLAHPDLPGAAGMRLVPEAAAALPSLGADRRTWTFRVRPGLRFSPPSGAPVTAEAFRTAIERAVSPRLGAFAPASQVLADVVGVSAYRAGRVRRIGGVRVVGDRLSITLRAPAGDLPARMAMPYFCATPPGTAVAPGGLDRPIPSAGPYYAASSIAGQTVLLRNPNYRGDRPRRPGRIVLTGSTGAEEAILLADRGGAEYVPYDFDPQGPLAAGGALARAYGPGSPAARRGDRRYYASPATGLDLLAFNTRRGPFANPGLRRAAAAALDRRAMARVWNELPSARLVPSGVLPAAAAPVAAASRAVDGGDRTVVLYICGDPGNASVGEVVRRSLRPLGLRVRLRTSLACLRGPDPARERADMALVTLASLELDALPFLNAVAGDDRSLGDVVPNGWAPAGLAAAVARADRAQGAARPPAFAALERRLAQRDVPMTGYGQFVAPEYLSPRLGCRLFQGAYGFLDLGAACVS